MYQFIPNPIYLHVPSIIKHFRRRDWGKGLPKLCTNQCLTYFAAMSSSLSSSTYLQNPPYRYTESCKLRWLRTTPNLFARIIRHDKIRLPDRLSQLNNVQSTAPGSPVGPMEDSFRKALQWSMDMYQSDCLTTPPVLGCLALGISSPPRISTSDYLSFKTIQLVSKQLSAFASTNQAPSTSTCIISFLQSHLITNCNLQ